MVQDPARGSHHHCCVGAQAVELAANRVAADHREDRPALSQLLELDVTWAASSRVGQRMSANVAGIGV